jgi:hypothetical protein
MLRHPYTVLRLDVTTTLAQVNGAKLLDYSRTSDFVGIIATVSWLFDRNRQTVIEGDRQILNAQAQCHRLPCTSFMSC